MTHPLELQGKVAIVTGAARGLGRAFALRLARMGADVVIADLNLDGAAEFGEQLGAASVPDEIRALGRRSLGVQGDLRERTAADQLIERTNAEFGRIDILVNNAGGALGAVERSFASSATGEDWEFMLQLNLMSTIYCCQAAVPHLRRRGGVIVNLASKAGLDPAARGGRLAPYGIAKTGVIQYTRFLANELGPHGIRVNCIAPGAIATARVVAQAGARNIGTAADAAAIPLGRLGTAEDVAGVLEFFVSEQAAYVTGQCLSVCGGKVLTPS
ncbi:MAG: SDR family NAD(P)-dependent oxidoreductase [Burkholderiales bacterium]